MFSSKLESGKKKKSKLNLKIFGIDIESHEIDGVKNVLGLDDFPVDLKQSKEENSQQQKSEEKKEEKKIENVEKEEKKEEFSYVAYVEKIKKDHQEFHSKLKNNESFIKHVNYAPLIQHSEDEGEMMRILLIRHAESEGNVSKNIICTTPDYMIPLSEKGIKQAQEAGQKIKEFFEERYKESLKLYQNQINEGKNVKKPEKEKVILYTSPYKRTRQTTEEIYKIACEYISDVRESIVLGEQQFGLFEGVEKTEDLEKFFPEEYLHFTKCVEFGGRFWARPPLGESRFDVATRVSTLFPKLIRDCEKYGVETAIIVSHGVTCRAFAMQWLNRTPEWFEKEPNPGNTAIRWIEKQQDKGYYFNGFLTRS